MSKPKLLDLFSGSGGCSYGYHQAGFDVVGIDIVERKNYPFQFIKSDALEYLDTEDLSQFDVIHASPVCKAYTNCNLSPKEKHPMQIADVRDALDRTGKPYIIENVVGAKHHMRASLMLCGSMFGLPIQRHRLFEAGNTDLFLYPPTPCDHRSANIAVYGHSVWDSSLVGTARKDGKKRPDSVSIEIGRRAMGIPWMGIEELAQAIPPAYTEYIGMQLLNALYGQEKAS
jgi:DNA (cytosine-5)-methyltransferase 1